MTVHSRSGVGFDVHPFDDKVSKKLILGGVTFEGEIGLRGHSDADVISHAITDAVLGAAGIGDIGEHFPDTDEQWRDANSLSMLAEAVHRVQDQGLVVVAVDCTFISERPKISGHKQAMQENLARACNAQVNVKASRAEGLGAIGRIEGAACFATATLSTVK